METVAYPKVSVKRLNNLMLDNFETSCIPEKHWNEERRSGNGGHPQNCGLQYHSFDRIHPWLNLLKYFTISFFLLFINNLRYFVA